MAQTGQSCPCEEPSQPRFVCCKGYNRLPVAVEPPSHLNQSDVGTGRHSVRHNVGPLPREVGECKQEGKTKCLNRREDVSLGPDGLQR